MPPEVTFCQARREDAEQLVQIYNAAFLADFTRYGICPGYGRSKDEMEQSIARYPKWILSLGDEAVGALSAREEDGTVFVVCLCVIPEYQGRGIGKRAMMELARLFPNHRRVELVTPADKEENIRFYTQRCGFRIVGEEIDGPVRLSVLRKEEDLL